MEKINNKKYLKYLPSKKFTIIMGISSVILLFIFLIFFLLSNKENFFNKNKNARLNVENQTVLDFIQKDTDLDGIPDWEEALWGTDKNKKMSFGETPDNVYIENKKKELNIEQELNDTTLTETEKFAREFFTAYTALKSSGEIDDITINNFSNALGQKIINPNLIDKYLKENVKIGNTDNITAKEKYYETIKNLFESYGETGLGEELEIINNGLITYNSTNQNLEQDKLLNIAIAYKEFSEKVMDTSVPESLVEYHLQIANSSNNLSISVSNMAKVTNDPIVGLSGISQYQKYSEDLVQAVEDLESILEIDLEE